VEQLESIAKTKKCTPGQLALAWGLQAHGDLVLPIPGTKSIKYLEENFAASNVVLSGEEMDQIRKVIDSNPVKGGQLAPAFARYLNN
jgi:aryl-alcohol dehydrogenase-like predicted oxidoreductase